MEGIIAKFTRNETVQDFLVVQWIRIHQPVQGTLAWSLVREDSTCLRQLTTCASTLKARLPGPCVSTRRSHCNEKPSHHNWRKPKSNKDPEQPKPDKWNGTFSLFKKKIRVSRPQHWWHLRLGSSLSWGLLCALPIHACSTPLPHCYDKHSCLQMLPCVPWGAKLPPVENHWSKKLALWGLIYVWRVNCKLHSHTEKFNSDGLFTWHLKNFNLKFVCAWTVPSLESCISYWQ